MSEASDKLSALVRKARRIEVTTSEHMPDGTGIIAIDAEAALGGLGWVPETDRGLVRIVCRPDMQATVRDMVRWIRAGTLLDEFMDLVRGKLQ